MSSRFVVLHLLSPELTATEVCKAVAAGVDGVWLIDHGNQTPAASAHRDTLLRQCVAAARLACPTAWLGINAIHLLWHPDKAIALASELQVDGVWLDQAFAGAPPVQARMCVARQAYKGAVFGGVAFKGQPQVAPMQDAEQPLFAETERRALRRVAKQAMKAVDVVITSGTATGVLPSQAKVRALIDAGVPVALSGAGMQMQAYPGVCAFFAATCLQPLCTQHNIVDKCNNSFCAFDKEKLREYVEKGREMNDQSELGEEEDEK